VTIYTSDRRSEHRLRFGSRVSMLDVHDTLDLRLDSWTLVVASAPEGRPKPNKIYTLVKNVSSNFTDC